MPLAPGTRLGPYEITTPIGAGGMGEVYQARDTRLDRVVAVKVSKEQFSERFDHEARAVAALNHPHICTLHDVGPNYLVMEYVEGTPLQGPLPIEKAIAYANQILDALDAAHCKGITHRDLKPDNILVTKQGIKLLDFGLAKQTNPLAESDATRALTSQGQIAGTLQYMSPEQLQSKNIDTRSDLFAFGCVLYEMLTGKRAFEGQNAASVVAAILEREPAPLTAAPPLDRVVRRALAKDPDQRFQTARDLKAALAWAMEQPPPSTVGKPSRLWWVGGLALIAVLIAVSIFVSRARLSSTASAPVRFVVYPPDKTAYTGSSQATALMPQFAVAPDGHTIVFCAAPNTGRPLLWMRPMDEATARPLAGTEGAEQPFWSADSRWVGFFAEGKLKRVPAAGGPAQNVAEELSLPLGGSWGPDDIILLGVGNDGIFRVSPTSATLNPVIKIDVSRQEASLRFPEFLPDGRHFLFFVRAGLASQRGVHVGSLDGKTRQFIVHSDWDAHYASPGYLLFLNRDTLLGQAFDAERLKLTGEPFTIAERVGHSTLGTGAVSVSRTGVLAYSGAILQTGRLIWFDREGNQLGLVGEEGDYTDFRLSPDGARLAAARIDPQKGNPDVWITDLTAARTSRLVSGQALNASPIWSPDSSRLVFRSNRRGMTELYRKSALGGGSEELLFHRVEIFNSVPGDWSPDGRQIVFSAIIASRYSLWLLPVTADATPVKFTDSTSEEMHGNFSPDGHLVAYSSNESGRFEVHVQTFPPSDRKWQVSTTGGYEPRWRGDGREVYYLSAERKLMAVPVGAGPSFGVPKALFQTRVPEGVNALRMHYVPSRDGRRFLVNTQSGDSTPPPITVVLNWTAGLKK